MRAVGLEKIQEAGAKPPPRRRGSALARQVTRVARAPWLLISC